MAAARGQRKGESDLEIGFSVPGGKDFPGRYQKPIQAEIALKPTL